MPAFARLKNGKPNFTSRPKFQRELPNFERNKTEMQHEFKWVRCGRLNSNGNPPNSKPQRERLKWQPNRSSSTNYHYHYYRHEIQTPTQESETPECSGIKMETQISNPNSNGRGRLDSNGNPPIKTPIPLEKFKPPARTEISKRPNSITN